VPSVNSSTGDFPAESAARILKELQQSYSLPNIEKRVTAGERAVWASITWALPLVRASGIIPLEVGALWRTHSLEAESIGENYFQIPPEFCSMVKVMAGRFHDRKPDPINKFLYFGSTCQPFADVMDLAKISGYDVYAIENVTAFKAAERRREVVDFLVGELKRVILWLNDGQTLDEEKIITELKRRNLVAEKIKTLIDLRRKAPFFLSNAFTLQVIMGFAHYFGRPDDYLALLDGLIAELKLAADETQSGEAGSYIPILFVQGGGFSQTYMNLADEARALVVGWPATVWDGRYQLDVPPLESIANYLLDAQPLGELGEVAGTSATYRCLQIERALKETGAKGIIISVMTNCPYGGVVQKNERDYFQRLNIPMVTIETTVHRGPPGEEQIMRVKTFFEMLKLG
jgi:benzoyl-CoA reductase/2-hydroxyglutaryl-CoA dehydratase subunit BcrC/BadD/HgdB